jgi:hypothetical protein
MKKIINFLTVVLLSFGIFLLCNLVVFALDDKMDFNEKLGEKEYAFFDKMYKKQEIEADGGIYVDFFNVKVKKVYKLEFSEVELEYLAWRVFELTKKDRDNLFEISETLKDEDKEFIQSLVKFLELDRTFMSIKEYLSQSKYIDENPNSTKYLFSDNNSQNNIYSDDRLIETKTDYLNFQLYSGFDEAFDRNNTYQALYHLNAEYFRIFLYSFDVSSYTKTPEKTNLLDYTDLYIPRGSSIGVTTNYNSNPKDFQDIKNQIYYKWNCGFFGLGAHHEKYLLGKRINVHSVNFTGNYHYTIENLVKKYPHAETLNFSYQSYKELFLMAPKADITLILDYFGYQKMILSSYDGELGKTYNFYITQEVHWNRNQYNVDSSGTQLSTIFPRRGDLSGQGWETAADIAIYFHRLGSVNGNNKKFLKGVTYYDNILQENTTGQYELVYSGNYNSATIVSDPLVTYTFNFGVNTNFASYSGLVPWSHYIRDVYPYLIWGNDSEDYINHTPFERFVWDKDSADMIPTAQNQYGTALTNRYHKFLFGIWDYGGTEIPSCVIDGTAKIQDITAPTFNIIADQTISITQTDINWATYITVIYDNMSGNLFIFEVSDGVSYGIIGIYYVTVAARDNAYNTTIQTFKVTVSSGGTGGSGGGLGGGGGTLTAITVIF